jgi:hypothetical protein
VMQSIEEDRKSDLQTVQSAQSSAQIQTETLP